MPPRWVCVAIVTFWLGTNGWLLWQEVWPTLQTGQPPRFTIDLIEEVQLDKEPQTVWSVFVNGEAAPSYRATTWVVREKANDLYVLHFHATALQLPPLPNGKPAPLKPIKEMNSRCRVTPAGDLRSLEAEVVTTFGAKASFQGEVRGDRFFSRYDLDGLLKGDLDPVPVAHDGAVFLPFHPVQRFPGLRPGQSWRVPSVVLPGLGLGGGRVHFVDARVLPTPEPLRFKDKITPCLVIEHTDDDQQTRTWVEQDGGLVLKQEAVVGTERWVLQRDR